MLNQNNKALYLQLADRIIDEILTGRLKGEDRLPSIREFGAEMQVNANTVVRTYDYLSMHKVIYNRRGVGFFVMPEAFETVGRLRREEVLGQSLDEIFRQLEMLNVDPATLADKYRDFLKKKNQKF